MTPLKTVTVLSLLITMLGLVTTKPAEQVTTTSEQGDDIAGLTADLSTSTVPASSPPPISLQCSGSTSSECKQTVDGNNNEQDDKQIEQKQKTVDKDDEQTETLAEQKQRTVDEDNEQQTETNTEHKQHNVEEEEEVQPETNTEHKQHNVEV